MTDSLNKDLERLDDVLGTYGADARRWPEAARRELSALLATSAEAKRRVRAADAFDRLLDKAPLVEADRLAALTGRIIAEAARTPRMAVSNSLAPPRPRAAAWRRHAGGIAALAASLMIGIFAGQSQTMAPAVNEVAAVVGLDMEASGQQVAQTDETDITIEEDLL